MLIATLGSRSFYISFFVSLVCYLAAFFVKQPIESRFYKISSCVINGLLICSFTLFVLCFVYSDFSIYSVFINSHTAKPLVYKVGAAWSSHEGSMLFWLFIVAIYNLVYSITRSENFVSCHFTNFFQLIVHGFILITVDPFRRYNLMPLEGNGFNPLLQDSALLIHPPILYLGYAGNLISFSIIVANAFSPYKNWLKSIKLWVIIPWSFLTLGVGLGSWWSYRELGWGGFWAWDPVENVSLLPWFAGLIFIHLSLIKKRSNLLDFFTKLNGILIFIFSLFATFIVRSGIVSSIHAFATSNERGSYLLILLGIFALLGLIPITFLDKDNFESSSEKSFKEKLIIYSSSLLSLCYIIIVFAIVVPIYINLYDGRIVSVGEKFYSRTFGIMFVPILILLNVLPLIENRMRWKTRLILSAIISGVSLFYMKIHFKQILILINSFLTFNIVINYILSTITQIIYNQRHKNDVKRINFASVLAHCGICIMIFGAIISTINNQHVEKLMDIKQSNTLLVNNGEYKIVLRSVNAIENPDFVGIRTKFTIWYKNQELGNSYPEVKFYKIEQVQLPDSDSFYHHFSDIYILVTGVDGDKSKIMVKIYYKQFVALIWIGCVMMGVSGFLSVRRKTS